MRHFKQKALILFSLLGALAGVAIATKPQDPLIAASQKLKIDADRVFRSEVNSASPSQVRDFFGTDHEVALTSLPYQKLFRQFAQTKELIEEASIVRQSEAIRSGKITRVADAAHVYFEQEKRLYFNYLKNLHAGKAHASDWTQLEKLDLNLSQTVAYALNLNDAKYMARYNLSHFRDADENYDQIRYSISPQEVSLLEQEALKEAPTENHYAELIQLLTVRERMTNQWAIHRMLGGSEDRSYFYACAKDLQSFHGDLKSNYYQTLWSADRSDELLLVKESLATATLNQPAISEDQLRSLYQKFFKHWPDFNRQMDSQGNADLAESNNAQLAPFYQNAPLETIRLVEKKWTEKEKGQSNTNAVNAIIHANFVGDVWDTTEVSDRIAWAAFEYRIKFYADLLVNHARGTEKSTFRIADVVKDPDTARNFAERLLRQELKPQAKAYRKRVREAVLNEWRKLSNFEKVSAHRKENLDLQLKNLSPAMTRIAQADYVLKNIDASLEQNRMEWVRTGKLMYLGKDFELAYLPARGLLKDRVKLYTPDQLSLFFSKKMELWRDLGGFFKTSGPNANEISAQVKALEKNRVVMGAVKRFFGILAERYYERMTALKLDPKSLSPDASPLFDLIGPVAQESYARFVKEITASPVGTRPDSKALNFARNFNPVLAKTDATSVRTAIRPNLESPKAQPAGQEERRELIKLYLTAMSLINLSEIASGSIPMVRDEAALALIPHSLMDVEHLLQTKSNEKRIADRLVHSLLDQKIAALTLKLAAMSENPFFNLRTKNEVDALKLGSQLVRFYQPGHLDMTGVKKMVKQYVHLASKNAEGLVEEACRAKPGDRNNIAMRNIFKGSQNLRLELTRQDSRFQRLDETLQLELRSPMEKLKDAVDPICTVLFWVTLIALSIYFGPVLWAGINTAIASGTLGAFTLGASGALESAGVAGGIKGVFATLLMGKTSVLMNGIFWAQMLVWTHVNCIELPDHLKYELRVAQSQIGMFSKAQISNEEIERFNQEIHVKKLTTYAMWPLQAGTLPVLVKGIVRGAKTVMGKTTSEALSEMTANGIKESTEQAVGRIREKDLSQLIAEEGRMAGTQKYLGQRINSLRLIGKVNQVAPMAMAADIRLMLADNLTTALEHDPAALVAAYDKRVAYLNQLGAKIEHEAESAHLISQVGKSIRTGEMDGASGFVKSSEILGNDWTLSQHLESWIKNLAAVHGLRNTKYWKIVIATDALDAVKSGKMLPGMNSNSEMRALILYAYVKDLKIERDYFMKNRALLALYLETGELTHQQLLSQHFRVFSDMDWAYHEGMLNWAIKKADKPWAARLNLSWDAQTAPMLAVKTAFKNYHVIRGELDQIRHQVLSQFSSDYFNRGGAAEAADITVDANGFSVVGPSALPPARTSLTEVFIDVPEGVFP